MSDSNSFEQLQLTSEDCSNLPISSFVSTFVFFKSVCNRAIESNVPVRLKFGDLIVTTHDCSPSAVAQVCQN
jgi:hypothetical protein